jgi:hypothetical protein
MIRKLDTAIAWLKAELANGPVETRLLMYRCRGMSWKTVEMAKRELGIKAVQRNRRWHWDLPRPW